MTTGEQTKPPATGAAEYQYLPPVPHSRENLDVAWSLVQDIAIRRIFFDGATSLAALSNSLKLSFPLVQELFAEFRQNQFVDITNSFGDEYYFQITSKGQERALNRLVLSHYAGPVPVSIRQYNEAVTAQAVKINLTYERLESALSDLVVPRELLEQLGPAIISQKSLFLHGGTGNGKTALAERLVRLYDDAIFVPHVVAVDNQIVMIYDPLVHPDAEIGRDDFDQRWMPCGRPAIIAGGELTLDMLGLQLESASNIYTAPLQMKANNGTLVIDDFGRQLVSPRELLNRWIVPLDRRVDYLALRHGTKFSIPFEVMVVFSTNLNPRDLADEAFLRRIHNKIHVSACTPEVFDEIFDRVVGDTGLPGEHGSAALFRQICRESGVNELRACYPRDICSILKWTSEFRNEPARITERSLRRAAELYFLQGKPE